MYYQLKGLVLRSEVTSEADKTIVLYTVEWGKVSVIVPGAKKIRAKFSSATEPVTESEFMVYLASPQARAKVTGARLVTNFPDLRRSWERFSLAQHCAEIAEILTPFNAENPKKYELLARTWRHLATAGHPWRIFVAFALRFLKLSGYSFIDYIRGEGALIPANEQKSIEQLSTLSGADVDTLPLDPAMETEIRRHLENYLNLHLPRPLAAREFWHKIRLTEKKKAST